MTTWWCSRNTLFYPSSGCVDVAELCGGGALTTKLLVRRGYAGGSSFGIVVGFDFDSPRGKAYFFEYIDRCKPYVLVMGFLCTGMKGFKELNRIRFPETYLAEQDTLRANWYYCL